MHLAHHKAQRAANTGWHTCPGTAGYIAPDKLKKIPDTPACEGQAPIHIGLCKGRIRIQRNGPGNRFIMQMHGKRFRPVGRILGVSRIAVFFF